MQLLRVLPLRPRLRAIRIGLGAIRKLREPAWRPPAPPETIRPGPLVLSGFVGETIGVGKAAELSVQLLREAGFAPEVRSLRTAFSRLLRGPAERLPGEGGAWMIHANAQETEMALMTHAPDSWADRYRIGYWAWETPEAPPSWVRAARWLHEIWVPSRFTAEALFAAFDRAGEPDQRAKVRVMPHPVRAPEVIGAAPPELGARTGLRALVMFDGRSAFARKNPWGAIEAWTRAFPEPGAHRLVVKGYRLDTDPRAARRLREALAARPDLILIERDLPDAALWGLIEACDIVLSTHRAEGFGLVPAEAMALGKAVVATGWSGNMEYMDAASAVLLPFSLIQVEDPNRQYRGSVWADPDIAAAAEALRRLAGDARLRARLGEAARRRIASLSEPWSRLALEALPFARFVERG